ncbi:MAG: carbamate kinase [Dehalococcoidia bacterium]
MKRRPPLTVVALGGNALSPPGDARWLDNERAVVNAAAAELATLAGEGSRLLVVHGNGPQAGRLLSAQAGGGSEILDICVAQTQGELGYLLAASLEAHPGVGATVAVITRTIVDPTDPAFDDPTKPIGPVLAEQPTGFPAVEVPGRLGWRRVVASPRPLRVVEGAAIARLLEGAHVVAGGGGGVPVTGEGAPVAAVIDKDWVAALLAIELHARQLVFVTDVPHAADGFGTIEARPIRKMHVSEARERLAAGMFAAGSMGPKVASAIEFVEAVGRRSVITTIGEMAAALRGERGTTIVP